MPDETPFDPSGLFPGLAKGQNQTIAVAGFNDALKAIFAGLSPLLGQPRTILHDFTPSAQEFLMSLAERLYSAIAALHANADQEAVEVKEVVDSLNLTITDLKNEIANLRANVGEMLTEEMVAALEAAAAKVPNIYPTPAPPVE